MCGFHFKTENFDYGQCVWQKQIYLLKQYLNQT